LEGKSIDDLSQKNWSYTVEEGTRSFIQGNNNYLSENPLMLKKGLAVEERDEF